MTDVTILGQGPMGQALATALLAQGDAVTVWNRSAGKTATAAAAGAAMADDPAGAVAVSPVTLVNLIDHDAVDAVLDAAGDAVADRTVVAVSSDTPDRVRATAEAVRARGGRFLGGAIMTPVVTIGTADASLLLAGPRATADAHVPLLGHAATTTWVGEDVGRAAAFDMALLDQFWTAVGGILHGMALARAEGIEPAELLPHAQGIQAILPAVVDELAGRLDRDDHAEPDASVGSADRSVSHLIAAAQARGLDAGALEALKRATAAVVAAGDGDDAVTRAAAAMAT